MLTKLGFEEINKGKTSGSRVKFERVSDNKNILLHKPHPKNILNVKFKKKLLSILKDSGDIEE